MILLSLPVSLFLLREILEEGVYTGALHMKFGARWEVIGLT